LPSDRTELLPGLRHFAQGSLLGSIDLHGVSKRFPGTRENPVDTVFPSARGPSDNTRLGPSQAVASHLPGYKGQTSSGGSDQSRSYIF
jgi:hypothetical protein